MKVHHLPAGFNCDDLRTPLNPFGFTVHSTGTVPLGKKSDTDEFNDAYFHGNKLDASAHVFVDYDSMTELLPWQPGKAVRAWHAGPKANSYFISGEMCEQKDPALHKEMYRRFIWFVANACFLYGWEPWERIQHKGVTLYRVHSHHDISTLLGGTDHVDCDHYLPMHGQNMDTVRDDVKAVLFLMKHAEEASNVRTFPDIQAHWAKDPIEHLANTKTPAGTFLANGKEDGNFCPQDAVTRAEMATMISRVLQLFGK